MNTSDILHAYLEQPDNDTFFSSGNSALIWLERCGYGTGIASGINGKLAATDQYRIELSGGGGITLKTAAKTITLPHPADKTAYDDALDDALRAIADFIFPAYRLCWCKESLGSDSLAFIVLPDDDYHHLRGQHGPDKFSYYFPLVAAEARLFALSRAETLEILRQREDGYAAYHERQERLLALEAQYRRGEIGRSTYRARKNALEGIDRECP